MTEAHFDLKLGPNLTGAELAEAALLLSQSYSRWQCNPRNTCPVATDTSPAVYARLMRRNTHEVCLYYEEARLAGVFVHSLSPQYDRYPLRKLSYLGVAPAQPGFPALREIFCRYAAFVAEQGEDVIIASDLDQTTLNSLLVEAGFREIVARNETFFLLSQLLQRQLFAFQKVKNDFVIDQIITLDGQAVRRAKKLFKLQTTGYDFYTLYRQQQAKRVHRSVPPANLALLRQAMAQAEAGIYFVASFDGTITLEEREAGGYNASRAMMGEAIPELLAEMIDAADHSVYLLPGDEAELRRIADRIVLRAGFYDFLFFCLKILGSFCVASAATPFQIRYALERYLGDTLPLRYIDLVEMIYAPQVELRPGCRRTLSDGSHRTAYRYTGPYVDLSQGYGIRKDLMLQDLLDQRGDNPAPLVYLGSSMGDAPALVALAQQAVSRRVPVVAFDFGRELTAWAHENLIGGPEANPWFSVVSVRDFYQIPVMLEEMGLELNPELVL